MHHLQTPKSPLTDWSLFYYVGIAFTPIAFFYFTMRFLELRHRALRWFLIVLYICSATLILPINESPDFLPLGKRIDGIDIPSLLTGYLLSSFLIILVLWCNRYYTEKDPLHKKRILLILISFSLSTVAFVAGFPNPGSPRHPAGPLVMSGLLLVSAYILFIYRVVKLQNILITLLHHFFVMLVLALPWALGFSILFRLKVIPSWQIAWLISVAAFTIFVPYAMVLQIPLSKKLFKHDRNSGILIRSFSDKIISLQGPDDLLTLIETMMVNVFQLKKICIAHKVIASGSFKFRSLPGSENESPAIIRYFLDWFKHSPEILFKDDINYDPRYHTIKTKINQLFDDLSVTIIVPIVQSSDLLGILFLETRHLPRSWEFRFLTQLQPHLIAAMNNSILYDNLHFLNRDLEISNEHLNHEVIKRTAELENALAGMHRMYTEQSNFINMASHHLRTPLTSIKAAATLLWANAPNQSRAGLNKILIKNIHRLEVLIKNIIEIAKIENGKIELLNEPVDIHRLILNCYLENELLFPGKSLEWSFDLNGGPNTILGDRKRLRTVLDNLISNAFKFTPQNGCVTVQWSQMTSARLSKYNLADERTSCVCNEFIISDNGDGIPEGEINAIFDIFRQVKESHKRYQGPGLGLFLVKKIIEKHNGAVLLESRRREGAHFSFLLPSI